MSRLFHRQLRKPLPTIARGEGCYLIDTQGRRYLDASGGAAVSCLGHSHPAIAAAMKAQIDSCAYVHSSYFTSAAAEALAERLTEGEPGGLSRAFFVAGGSEAVEAAIKLARQYFLETGEPGRHHFISRRQSYHGNTLGALSISGNEPRRAPYLPYLFETTRIAPCYPYRDRRADESEEQYGLRVANELSAALERLGAKNVAAFVAETVCGATLGAQPAVPGYFKRIREICDANGILLILDEVMCGMGRTGSLYAFEAEGVAPDIVTCAKGLGAGYQPIGAVMVSRKVVDAITRGTGALRHGHTYMAHPVSCAAALAVQDAIRDENLLANVREQGARLMRQLAAALGASRQGDDRVGDHVGDIRGRGLLVAVELVADRATKAPFDPGLRIAERVKQAAFELGLICYPSSGTVDGTRGDHVLLAPPYISTQAEIDEAARLLASALAAVLSNTTSPA
ncbi:MAG: aspartate aminotransferase family protein [Burkholderiaceae bacterium]|nr:aspartate aminotransferase family protein [Burkholderiaceae bacterium]